jgi:UPF0042 nucleotide-binding protein
VTRARRSKFVILTGLSGAGKSNAIHALEDQGYYCVDNLPVSMLPGMADFARDGAARGLRVAVVVDMREPRFTADFPDVLQQLRQQKAWRPTVLFLEASHDELIRRFSESRRPHPLATRRPMTEGLAEERASMQGIRASADHIIDSTTLNVHELRARVLELVSGSPQAQPLVVTFLSFGFHYGVPTEADLVFDVRFLKNPHWETRLRPQTGRDRAVKQFMRAQPKTAQTITRLTSLLQFLIPQYVSEGKAYLTVAIGCTGGRHRSVYVSETLRTTCGKRRGITVQVKHRELERQP